MWKDGRRMRWLSPEEIVDTENLINSNNTP
jgi:hypothetical protein